MVEKSGKRRPLDDYPPALRCKVPPELLIELDDEGLSGQEIADVLRVEYGLSTRVQQSQNGAG